VWSMVAAERSGLADELEGLSETDWNTPSLCAGWRVRDVVAHLVWPLHTSMVKVVAGLVVSRFDFNRLADKAAKTDRRPGPELAEALRQGADHRFTPPGFGPEAPLADLVVHGQDIRDPLGIPHTIDAERARVVLDLLVSPKATRGFVRKGLTEGLTFQATDLDWSAGKGLRVAGPGEALIMVLTGRTAPLANLDGEGTTTLRTRLS
jgi:uncharacterized protein (TIGR03083 family)